MKFKDKTIIIVSQQDWGQMFISKHHYALELSKLGNKVYFLNSPEKNGKLRAGEIRIEKTQFDNLWVIQHRLFYPYIIKHKALWLHNILLKRHINNILKRINEPVDIVWSFDYSNTIPLISFPGSMFKIFMPVDEPKTSLSLSGARSAKVILSVTNEILDMYAAYRIPKMFVNHGVLEIFLVDRIDVGIHEPVQIGCSGNFLRPDIDWDTLLKIIESNSKVQFHFYGPTEDKTVNLADANTSVRHPAVEQLKSINNVTLHGVVDTKMLAAELKNMDGFLVCYDIQKDHSSGTNYHKLLEYMATGKVIIANNTSTYAGSADLVEMPDERDNSKLPGLFTKVINNLSEYNCAEKQEIRVEYATRHTYRNNIGRIEQFIAAHVNG